MLIHRDGASKVCLFSSYFKGNQIPYYVKFYLKELRRFFDQVVMLTNNDRDIEAADVSWLKAEGIDLMLVPNEGFDFGMWQKALPLLELGRLDRLAFVNDSCFCLGSLDGFFHWAEAQVGTALGITKSLEHEEHLQSYFIYLKDNAIAVAAHYVERLRLGASGYNDVVIQGEIGLSRFLRDNGINISAIARVEEGNSALHSPWLAIDAGVPMVKKKVLINPSGGTIRHCIEHGFGFYRKQVASLIGAVFGTPVAVCGQLIESGGGGDAVQSVMTALRVFRYRVRFWLLKVRTWLVGFR